MTDEPDLDLAVPADGPDAVAEADADAVKAEAPALHGAIAGRVAVGRYVLEVGDPPGGVVREASPAERPDTRSRPAPILLRPSPIRGLVGRCVELAAATTALDSGLPVEVSGPAGVGKTAILRHLAHHPGTASYTDGIVYLAIGRHSPADVWQRLFEAFYESGGIYKATDAEIRSGLRETQALILLDDVHLTQDELEQVLDIAPRAAFVVATRERRLWREVRGIALNGLPADEAVSLLEREIERPLDGPERPLDGPERSAAASLCADLGGHPLRLLQAAALIRERGITPDGWARDMTPENLITELMASLDEKQTRALLALTALPGVPLQMQHVSGIAEVTDAEPALTSLIRRGLVVNSHSRYRLADGVGDRLRRTDDLKPSANRAITYFIAWAERNRRSAEDLLNEFDALLRVQQSAVDARRWGEVLHLGRLLEGALVVGARWGAWSTTLDRCLAAAKAIGDRPAEAWALHQRGTRAVCLGEAGAARALLHQAVDVRQSLNDEVGVAASRRNLSFVLVPVVEPPRRRATLLDDWTGLDPRPLRQLSRAAGQSPKTPRIAAALITLLLCTMLGALGYTATRAVLSSRSSEAASTSPPAQAASAPQEEPGAGRAGTEVQLAPADPALTSTPLAPVADPVTIRIFSPRPGSISAGGRTELCYALNGAVRARLQPGVGEISPTSTLTCLRVSPVRPTTYQLTAYGRSGDEVSQQLVIVVR